MSLKLRLLFGPLAAVIFVLGVALLPLMVPNYSSIHQTVSEIGEVGSPARIPFSAMLCSVGLCVLIFASGVRDVAIASNRSRVVAYLTAYMAIPSVGIGIFAFPHPLHNIFGISEVIGYHAPLALALTWRKDPGARSLVWFSWIVTFAIWVALGLNMSGMFRDGIVWAHVKPVIGLAQRALFGSWFVWSAVLALVLIRKKPLGGLHEAAGAAVGGM
jgi:hypothetical membrane protein